MNHNKNYIPYFCISQNLKDWQKKLIKQHNKLVKKERKEVRNNEK